MAGCKSSVTGEDFYGAYDAQDKAREFAPKLGMDIVPSLNIVYTEEKGYVTADVAKEENLHMLKLSGRWLGGEPTAFECRQREYGCRKAKRGVPKTGPEDLLEGKW